MALAKRVVVCVFDGLRRDLVSPERTPNLHRFATGGTWYRDARSVFPSMTRVCTTSFATGARPAVHGIVNNAFFHRSVGTGRALDTSKPDDIDAAEAMAGGRFVPVATLGDVLADAGKRYFVVHSGSAGSAYFVNHRARANGHATFALNGAAATRTPAVNEAVTARYGPIPAKTSPDHDRMDYAAKVFVEHVLGEVRPDVALIWFCEPDASFHFRDIGSDDAMAVLARVDAHFGTILEAVAADPDADDTAVIAMSDHGQIATSEAFDLFAALEDAGMPTASQSGDGARLLSTTGIMAGLTRTDPSLDLLEVGRILMGLPQTGMVLSRGGEASVEGTLPYHLVGLDHPHAPELVWIGRSNGDLDRYGLAGTGVMTAGGDVPVGGGMHGGLHPIEQNTVLAFGGAGTPSLGEIADAADLTDIAPTLLWLLGLEPAETMTGRPLPALSRAAAQGVEARTVRAEADGFAQELTLWRTAESELPAFGGRVG